MITAIYGDKPYDISCQKFFEWVSLYKKWVYIQKNYIQKHVFFKSELVESSKYGFIFE